MDGENIKQKFTRETLATEYLKDLPVDIVSIHALKGIRWKICQ